MSTFRLITSAAYVDQELAIEFGQIPPAFLPMGNARLYESQISEFGAGGQIHLSVPEGFAIPPADARRLSSAGVVIVPVPTGLTLGESIVYTINAVEHSCESITILHGDTLIEGLDHKKTDCVAIHSEGDDYAWAAVEVADNAIKEFVQHDAFIDRPVVCGYFAFSSLSLLVRSITRARGNFIAGLNQYTRERELTAFSTDTWKDFGHIQTYFRSRRAINTARSFNTLQIDAIAARKRSRDTFKMEAEARWLRTVPPSVQPYCARLYDSSLTQTEGAYSVNYEYAPTLSELLVFSSIGRSTWRKIIQSCQGFLDVCSRQESDGPSKDVLTMLSVGKTKDRLERFAFETGYDIYAAHSYNGEKLPSLASIASSLTDFINLDAGGRETIMHGDLCFSKILYNSRSARIIVIDPRGYIKERQPTCYGDLRYDLAKLHHSVVGGYDYIIADRFRISKGGLYDYTFELEFGSDHEWIVSAFSELHIGDHKLGSHDTSAIAIGLFLSMLPLHADRPDRQSAFIANALRLHRNLEAA